MSFRGLILSLAGLWGCASALHAQAIPALPPCLFGQDEGPSCAVGAPFSFDLGQFFELSELASLFNSFSSFTGDTFSFVYTLSVTDGSLPPGLSLTPSGLLSGTFGASGDYNFTITITEIFSYTGPAIPDVPPSQTYQVPIPFEISVTGYSGPQVTVEPGALNFNLIQSAAPSTQSVTITNHGSQAVTFTASAQTNAGGNWLSAAQGGTVPATGASAAAITVDPSGLAPGTYSGSVTIPSSDGSVSNVSVLLVVTSSQPNLALSQTGLFFYAVSGGTASPPQPVTVLNTGSGTLNFTASAATISGGSWLSVSPGAGAAGGSAPGSVTVTADPTNLQPGTYYGTVSFAASGAADSPQVASVVLNVVAPANSPGAQVEPAGLIFVGSAGGNAPAAQTITITNPSPDALTYLVTPFSNGNVTWLSAAPTAGSVVAGQPASVSVSVNVAGLTAGVYIGDLTVALSSASTAQSLDVKVVLVVLPQGVSPSVRAKPQPHATCSPTQLIPVFTLLGSGFSATAAWPTELEVTVVDDCGKPLNDGSVTVTFSTGDPALSLKSIGNGSWTATWNAANAAPNVTITAQAQALNPALTGTSAIGGTLQSNTAVPLVNTGGVVSAANFVANQPLAPGSFGAIFGTDLSDSLTASTEYPLSNQLGSTSVILGGKPLPLLFASSGQINMVVPYNVPVNSTQQLIVQRGSAISIPQSVVIASALPAVFTQNGAGNGAAIVQVYKPDGTLLPLNSPASVGDTIVLYCSGLGAVNPAVAAGAQAPSSPLSNTVNPVTVSIGGVQQRAGFAGLTPGFAQLYQVNVQIPSGAPSGTDNLTVSVAGQQSAPVTIVIQ